MFNESNTCSFIVCHISEMIFIIDDLTRTHHDLFDNA